MSSTTNFGWVLPTVGGDNGAWGTILNDAMQSIDDAVASVNAAATGALARTGGTMSGALTTKTTAAARSDLGNVSGAVPLALNAFMSYTATIVGATTFSITDAPSGAVTAGFTLQLTNGGAFAITWPASVKWHEATPPSLTAVGTDLLVFISHDAGVTWIGNVVAQAIG